MSTKSVMDLLATEALEGFEPSNLRRALDDAACWPTEATAMVKALRIRPEGPSSPLVGTSLLVSISQDGARTALWRLHTAAPSEHEFLQDARRCVDTAIARTAQDLPCLIDPSLVPASPRWGARFLWQRGPGADRMLDDLSYGLSMALAASSQMTGLPLPHMIAASATLDAHGKLGGVGGLPEKLRTIAESALGVSVVYIAEQQRETDDELLLGLPRVLELRRRARLRDVLGEVFADAERELQRRWADPRTALADARRLFLLALRSSGTQNWSGVALAARWLATFVDDPAARDEARFAWQVAQRHAGRGELVAWPEESFFDEFGRRDRLQFIAHVVQAARDAGAPDRLVLIERALREIAAPRDRSAGDWIVLGALGRAWASLGREQDARVCLEAATTGWFRDGEIAQASRPLCEWIRLAGVAGDRDEFAKVKQMATTLLDEPSTPEGSRTFVWFELGRSAVLLCEHPLALDLLKRAGASASAADHVRRSSRRWLARAHAALGDRPLAAMHRSALLAEAGDCVEVRLCKLDEALEGGADVGTALEAVRESDPGILSALVASCADGSTDVQAYHVARHYPY